MYTKCYRSVISCIASIVLSCRSFCYRCKLATLINSSWQLYAISIVDNRLHVLLTIGNISNMAPTLSHSLPRTPAVQMQARAHPCSAFNSRRPKIKHKMCSHIFLYYVFGLDLGTKFKIYKLKKKKKTTTSEIRVECGI